VGGRQTTSTTTSVTNSEGERGTETSSHEKRTDGSRTDTTHYGSRHADGSTYETTSRDDWDSSGHEHHPTDVSVDKDGNRTTTTEWATYDEDGNMLDHGGYSVHDEVSPPGEATPAPGSWTGTITYSFAGEAGGPDEEGITTSGSYADAAV
jgi:hypothetical protein